VDDALKKAFRPEFLNRLDETIIFDPLTRDDILQIVALMTKAVQERLVEQKIGIELSPGARDWLANEGYDPIFGARPLRRAIQRYVENPLANRILSAEFNQGDTVLVTVDETSKLLIFTKAVTRIEVMATA
jgi:ATP-dependent Clp protease ATP-binding subunit ClpA